MISRAALLLVSALAAQGISLRWTPKEGDEIKYRTEGVLNIQGVAAKITAINAHKVIRVDSDGSYLVQATPVEGEAEYLGTKVQMKGVTTLTTYGPGGELKEIRGDKVDSTGYRMANLTNFHAPTKPVAVGDAWTSEGKADPKTGAVGWKVEYKVVGEETFGAFAAIKMDVKARETEGTDVGTAAGSVWVGKDGILVRSELTWSNLAVPGAPGLVDGKLTQTRI